MENTNSAVILLIESNPSYSKLLQENLKTYGLNVLTTDTGPKALEMVKSGLFNVILIDEKIREMDIKDFWTELKLTPKTNSIPLVLLSLQEDSEYRARAIDTGIDGYFIKPVEFDYLAKELHDLIGSILPEHSLSSALTESGKTKIITITSSKGGTGVSTIVANLGDTISGIYKKKTLLIDAAGYTNHLSVLLNTTSKSSLADLCTSGAALNEESLMKIINYVSPNLGIITLVNKVRDIQSIKASVLQWVLETVVNKFDFIIADIKTGILDDVSLTLIKEAKDLLLVTTYDPLAMRDTKAFIGVLRDFGIPEKKIKLMINRANCDIGGLDPNLIHKNLGNEIFCTLPNDWFSCIEATNKGKTLLTQAPKSKLTKEITVLSQYFVKEVAQLV